MTGIHFLLTYTCVYECDHCFLYCSPRFDGTFPLEQLQQVFAEIDKMPDIDNVYFEGGEPFLYYPLMLEGIKMAEARGLSAGIVTNSYWGLSKETAKLYLEPLTKFNNISISLSDDQFHFSEEEDNSAKKVMAAAIELGMDASSICIEKPSVEGGDPNSMAKGAPVVGGGVKFRGRAADKLAEGLPLRDGKTFTECPFEELRFPGRVHVDPIGHTHICQGISMGNFWQSPLSELVKNYDPESHPIIAPLLKGGPAELARAYGIEPLEAIEECHLCYLVRKQLLDRFPEYLTPKGVYGVEV